ncbi:type II secretion system GspH family protein [bacterium]|nr:type II secretion system GspH family protein [bacterium]MBU1957416.1 type II secretion system GspH family protein [bacterium]
MKKNGFTLVELVFVIVVLGILASMAVGRMERDVTQEASSTILSNIRLAQQQALNDNKHRTDNNPNWQRAYWRFEFDCTSDCTYRVGSDINLNGTIEKDESAVDPTDGKYLFNDGSVDNEFSTNVLIQKEFGINSITPSGGCANSGTIAFDYFGRPHINIGTASNNFSTIMNQDCNLTFGMLTLDSFTITIESETGYATTVGQPDL